MDFVNVTRSNVAKMVTVDIHLDILMVCAKICDVYYVNICVCAFELIGPENES